MFFFTRCGQPESIGIRSLSGVRAIAFYDTWVWAMPSITAYLEFLSIQASGLNSSIGPILAIIHYSNFTSRMAIWSHALSGKGYRRYFDYPCLISLAIASQNSYSLEVGSSFLSWDDVYVDWEPCCTLREPGALWIHHVMTSRLLYITSSRYSTRNKRLSQDDIR